MRVNRFRLLAGLALLVGAPSLVGIALAQSANTANYQEQGGKSWVIGDGGTLTIKSGGTLAVSGGATVTGMAGSNTFATGTTLAIASGATLNAATGSTVALPAGTTVAGSDCLVSESVRLTSATPQTSFLMVANRGWKLTALRARIATAQGGAATAQLTKVPDGVATSSAVAMQTGTFNLNASSDTAQVGVPVATANGTLAAGDAVWLSLSTTIGNTVGVLTFCLAPV